MNFLPKIVFLVILVVGVHSADNKNTEMECTSLSASIRNIISEFTQLPKPIALECLQSTVKNAASDTDTNWNDLTNILLGIFKEQLSFIHSKLTGIIDERIKNAINEYKPNIIELVKNESKDAMEEFKLKLYYLTQTMNDKYNYLNDLIGKLNCTCTNENNCIEEETLKNECLNSLDICKEEVKNLTENCISDGQLPLHKLIPTIYAKNLLHAAKILELLNFHPSMEERILGYRILYHEMKKNGHDYSTVATTIAFQVKTVFMKAYPENENVIALNKNLPESLKLIPWNEWANVTNKDFTVGLHTQNYVMSYLSDLPPYTTPNCTRDSNFKWAISSSSDGLTFKFYHNLWKNHLYAAQLGQFQNINNRRHVYSWSANNKVLDEEQWQFEAIPGSEYVKIKNMKFNEYLYMSYTEDAKELRRYNDSHILFTSPNLCTNNNACNWKITSP